MHKQGAGVSTFFEYLVFEGITILSPERRRSLLPAISKITSPSATIITSSKGWRRSLNSELPSKTTVE